MEKDNRKLISLGKGPSGGGGGDTTWGSITGVISSQTDLMNELNKKANTSSIPTKTSDLTNDSGYITLSDVPAQVNSDWNSNSGVSQILNKPAIPTVNNATITIKQDGTTVGTFTTNDATDTTINLTGGGSGAAVWGTITGTLNDQTDLKNALDGKASVGAIPSKTSDLTNDSGYITISDVPAQVNSDWNSNSGVSQILNKPTLSTVATSGSYNDLTNKPTLATVATSGSYNDLSNKPTIPTATSDLTNDSGYITISDVPAQVQSDWTESDTASPAYIVGKPTIPTVNDSTITFQDSQGSTIDSFTLNQSSNKTITLPSSGGGAVWGSITGTLSNQTDLNTALGNKANTSDLATVATSGNYNDLSNKPTIPAAQVQSDWNQSDNTAVDYIKNKPTIPAAQVQSDWNQSNNQSLDYIKNKPSMSTETLTFVDANNVSTTVVVYTQPQI